MELDMNKNGNVLEVNVLSIRFTNKDSAFFRDKMKAAIDDGNYDIALQLSGVDYMDSSALGALVSVNNHLTEKNKSHNKNGKIVIWGLSQNVKTIFSICKADSVFNIYETKEEALKEFE